MKRRITLGILMGATLVLLGGGRPEPRGPANPENTQNTGKTGKRLPRVQAAAKGERDPQQVSRGGVGAARGNMFLRQGSSRAAIASFQKQLKENPDAPAIHIGLGKALARSGRCAEALEHFWPYVGTTPFGGDAALAASTCSARLDLLEDAVYFDRFAVELAPESARAWSNLALDLANAGDSVGVEDTLDQLMFLRPDRDASAYVRAVLALRAGDIPTFDAVAFAWEKADGPTLDLRRLQAQSWLDMDNPVAAMESLKNIHKVRNGQQVRLTRAEALRRMGYAEEGALYMEDRPQNKAEGIDADAIRVRLSIDVGDLDAARELLDSYEGRFDADMTASAWYLARHDGRKEDQAALEARYERLQENPLRTLDQLVPWTDR